MSKDFTYEGSTGPTVGEYELMGTSTDGSPIPCITRREDGQTDYKELEEDQSVANKTHADAVVGQKMDLKVEVPGLPEGVTITGYQWTIPGVNFKSWTPNQTKAVLAPLAPGDRKNETIQFYWVDAGQKMVSCVATRSDGMEVSVTANFNVVAPDVTFNHTPGTVQFAGTKFLAGLGNVACPVGPGLPPATIGLYNFATGNGTNWDGKVVMPAGWPGGEWDFTQIVTSNSQTFTLMNGEVNQTFHPAGPPSAANPDLDVEYPYRGQTFQTGPNFENSGDSPFTNLVGLSALSRRNDFIVTLMFRPPGTNSQYVPTKSMAWFAKAVATNGAAGWVLNPASGQGFGAGPRVTTTHPIWKANTTTSRFVMGSLSITLPATKTEGAPGQFNAVVRLTGLNGAALTRNDRPLVNLVSNDTSRLTVPPTVEIPQGQSMATFPFQVIDNNIADGDTEVTITASLAGLADGVGTIQVVDND